MVLLIMLFIQCCLESFIQFKVKRPQEARDNQFLFQIFKIMRFLRSLKYSKTTVELTFTTQKANACSPSTAFSVFN